MADKTEPTLVEVLKQLRDLGFMDSEGYNLISPFENPAHEKAEVWHDW